MATDVPKVTFMKKLLLSAMFFGVFSMQQVHAANVMEGIFKGMVASTDPASVRTASRVGAVGGSFSYRQPQVNTNLVNVSFPKASVGCNGIDIFLGSFSMINGDQLVQIGRGIAQGSAVYAFNTAVSAICADCAAIIANIQDKLAALNKFAKDSCNATYEFLQNGLGTPQEFTEKIGLGGGAVDSMVSGIFPDFGSTMSQPASEVNKKNYAKDPDAFKEKYAGNIVYQGFMSIDNGNMNVGGVTELTGYKLAEQIMSLTGTLIVSWDSNGENSAITPIPPTMKAADFIKGTGSGNVKLNVCNPTPDLRSNRKAQCLEMRQDSIQFKGLSETIIETLLEIQRAVRNDTELTQDQRKLISMLGVNNIIPTLQTLSAAEGVQYINDISTIAAKNFTIELLSSVQNKMTNMTLPSEAMASFKDQLEKINQTFRNQIRSASEVQSIQNTEEKTVLAYWDMAYVKKRTYGDSGSGG